MNGLTDDWSCSRHGRRRRGALPRACADYVERIRELRPGGGDAGSEAPFGSGPSRSRSSPPAAITAIDAVLEVRSKRLRAGPSARPSRATGSGNGFLPVRECRDRRSARAGSARPRRVACRLGRAPRQRHPGDLLARPLRARDLVAPGRPLPCALGAPERDRRRRGAGTTLNVPLPAGSGTGAFLDASTASSSRRSRHSHPNSS